MSRPSASASLVYADLEHPDTNNKELSLLYSQSRVPLQRLLCAKTLCEEDDDYLSTAAKLSKDSEWTVREAIADRLNVFVNEKDEKKLDRILSLLSALSRDVRFEVRKAAAKTLGKVPTKSRVSIWIALCKDPDSRYRACGAECLGYGASQNNKSTHEILEGFVLPELVYLAKEDENFTVRKAACKSIGQVCKDSSSWINSIKIKQVCAESIYILAQDSAWPVRRICSEVIPWVCTNGGDEKVDSLLGVAIQSLIESETNDFVKSSARRNLGYFLGVSKCENADLINSFVHLGRILDEDARYAFAYYLPGVLLSAKNAENLWTNLVKPVYMNLAQDSSSRLRRCLSYSLHCIAKLIGPTATNNDLLIIYNSFLQDMDEEEEVRLGVMKNSADFLSCLPASARLEAFDQLQTAHLDVCAPPLNSLAVSRDSRVALAVQLPALSKITPPLPGLGKLLLLLAKDEAYYVREKALDSFGEVVPFLEFPDGLINEFVELASSTYYWNRWAFARGTLSILRNDRSKKMFEWKLSDRLQQLKQDAVLTVSMQANAVI